VVLTALRSGRVQLKLILPLRKGNALGLAGREFITVDEARDAFGRLTELRTLYDWRPALRMTPWTAETEGHMIVVEPSGDAQAWPVYDQPDLFLKLGNLLREPVTRIWDRYPYKRNHFAKYLGASIYTAAQRPVMEIYTNMAWPDDPYRTGQQLYSRSAPRLAAFTVESSLAPDSLRTTTAAMVYLPLHRTRPVTVTGPTLTFGFRAASITGQAEAGALAALADLDLSQARRHAAILTGCMLPRALAELQRLAGITLRGLSAVQEEWAGRHTPAEGRAAMFDCLADLPGQPFLEDACQQACLTARPGSLPAGLEETAAARMLAALLVERALIMALVCARHLGRYTWEGTLNTGDIIAASTWDCLA
jgi:hypothetical protein